MMRSAKSDFRGLPKREQIHMLKKDILGRSAKSLTGSNAIF